jgi:mono/diheme cytochrome c family protein
MRTIRRLLYAMPFTGALALVCTETGAQTPASVARGKEIAERVCAGCHAMPDGQGSKVQGTDVPSFLAIAGRPARTPENLQVFIMTPRHPMPAIPLELGEIRDVVAYIESLK